jgi:molybdate transport repressor ModE-like protein
VELANVPHHASPWDVPSLVHQQRLLDPLRLRLLVEVKRRGSISAAAIACMIGQPSASLHLRSLEQAVGRRLIERDARGSRLTPMGEIVVQHAEQVLSALDGLSDDLRAYEAGLRGTLAVAASSAASYLLPPALRVFRSAYPEVDVSVRVTDGAAVRSMVALREVALGLAGDASPMAGVEWEHLLDVEVVGIAAPGVLPDGTHELRSIELASHTLLVLGDGSSQHSAASGALRRRPDAVPARTWLLDSTEAVKRAVRERLGVAFLSRLAVRDEIERGELVPFRLVDLPRMEHAVYVAQPSERRGGSRVRSGRPPTAPPATQKAFTNAVLQAFRAVDREPLWLVP